jgi:hypothetical protein
MFGLVKTTFANPNYLVDQCDTPIQSNSWDPDYSEANVGQTCLTIDHAAQSFHNCMIQIISRCNYANLAF